MDSRCFDALGFSFTIDADDARLSAYLCGLFKALRTPALPVHRYCLTSAEGDAIDESLLLLDGECVRVASTSRGLVTPLVHDVNQQAVATSDLVTIHAGGVAYADVAVAFPGVMDAGKTTLVAGLIRRGFGYLTDEAVAVDGTTLLVRPYPKPLCLERGSWSLFPELEPFDGLVTNEYVAEEWQVPPDAIRAGAVAAAAPIGVIVFPRFEPAGDTTLSPVRRAEALVELARHTFGFRDRSSAALDVLANVVRAADCYHLTMANLDDAVDLVSSLVGMERTREATL